MTHVRAVVSAFVDSIGFDATMSDLLKNTSVSIWHAFNALQQIQNVSVHKSKLKVLTANIGTLLDLHSVEKGLEHFQSTPYLNFENFIYYLDREVFSSLPKELPLPLLKEYEAKIDEVCWLVCHRKYVVRQKKIIPDESVYKIFRIFCLLAELITDDQNENKSEALLHITEAKQFCERLVQTLGLLWDESIWTAFMSAIMVLSFPTFLTIIETKYCGTLDEIAIVEAIEELYQTYVQDVIKKGYLYKKGHLLQSMKEYWFILKPNILSYAKESTDKEICGSMLLDPSSFVTAIQERDSPKTERLQKLNLITGDRVFELATEDHKTRLQWITAFQLAITYSNGMTGYQRSMALERRKQREQKLNQETIKRTEEAKRIACQLKEVEETRAQLLLEKLAREAAESQAQKLQAIAEEESQKVREMQDVRLNLERMLEEETQAKRDEEIVRALQARELAAEWERREELERVQEEQKCLLEEERKKRQEFEKIQLEKEAQLREAEKRLKELELQREKLDKELKSARQTISSSEDSKNCLASQLREPTENIKYLRGRRAFSMVSTNNAIDFDNYLFSDSKNSNSSQTTTDTLQ